MVPMGMWPSKRPPQGSTPSSSIRRSLSLRLASKTSGGSGTVSWLSCEKAVPNKALRSTYSAESHVSYAKGESHASYAEGESHVSYAEDESHVSTPKAKATFHVLTPRRKRRFLRRRRCTTQPRVALAHPG